jgi:hypothetical protein
MPCREIFAVCFDIHSNAKIHSKNLKSIDCLILVVNIAITELHRASNCWKVSEKLPEVICLTGEGHNV